MNQDDVDCCRSWLGQMNRAIKPREKSNTGAYLSGTLKCWGVEVGGIRLEEEGDYGGSIPGRPIIVEDPAPTFCLLLFLAGQSSGQISK